MYNITLEKVEKIFDFKENFLYKDFSIFKTEDVKIASSQCKKDQIIYLKTYEPSMEIIQKAKEKQAIFLINLLDIINAENAGRSILINKLKLFLKLCIKYKIKFILSFLASNEMEMRTFKEGVALGVLLGLKPKQAKDSFNYIKEITEIKNEY